VSSRKSSCNKLHPDEPSEIRVIKRVDCKNSFSEVCMICSRVRQRARYAARKTDSHVLPRLNWAAPELLK
jgi:hypothetical protein